MGRSIVCAECGESTGYCGCCGDGPWYVWDEAGEEIVGGPYCDACHFKITGVWKTAHVIAKEPTRTRTARTVRVRRASTPPAATAPWLFPGDKSRGLCATCGLSDTTFEIRDLPVGAGIVTGVLVGICDACGEILSIPPQSSPEIAAQTKK